MKYFLINILLLFALTSCTLSTTKGLTPVSTKQTTIGNPYFSDAGKDYVYKANITAYGHRFGGLMIVKKIGDMHHRIVFTTEMGNKMLDAELKRDHFTLNFIADALNRKMLLKTLERDFKILLREKSKVVRAFENADFIIYKSERDGRFNFYFMNKANNRLAQVVNTTRAKEKVIIDFTSKDGKIAESILIEHKDLKLRIALVAI